MRFLTNTLITFLVIGLSGATSADLGFCYNRADPDRGIGNFCQCEGNGECYYRGANNSCDPVGDALPNGCP
ncbi:hypothetical protein ASPWEDRAFT_176819 [Aspergillus wentii DTO 134E9]|uniref:Uncharacterized protein n=1 Tax=Aspergillus wentii DTO 134E9 TaxID=1073089 RepID=A0A1L9R5F4_ASPWE|nr:uncharacterized protein ASPWEDRAFT_176819 [Aspergillus wentii DTO 134E9]OJJ30149.1 hypothetical protein ASPWEDRAFT_176819 [Aspergillus wentii DTO 134E9]